MELGPSSMVMIIKSLLEKVPIIFGPPKEIYLATPLKIEAIVLYQMKSPTVFSTSAIAKKV